MEGFTEKILSLYAKGMTTRDIENHVCEIYGIEIFPQFISRCVEDITTQVTQWQNRPLDSLYPIVYVDGHFVSCKSGENKGPVVKRCIHIVLGITVEGKLEILSLWIQDTEAARYWLDIFNNMKAREVKDIVIICGDGLNGLPSAASVAFSRADVELCVVH
jgi:transposase-like protein